MTSQYLKLNLSDVQSWENEIISKSINDTIDNTVNGVEIDKI